MPEAFTGRGSRVGVELDADPIYLFCRDGVLLTQVEQQIESGMKHAGAGIEFNRDTRFGKE